MLAELRTKSQITLPKAIVKAFDLHEGDRLDVFERDGMICLMPVAIYPKQYVEELVQEVAQLKEKIASGTQPVFSDIDALMKKLEED